MTLGFSDVNFDVSKGVETGTDNNFIPANTVYHIEADGSGDFATIKDAIDSLNGKLSNDAVTIELGAGTFDISSTLTIDGSKFHIPQLILKGVGVASTIINSTITTPDSILSLDQKLNCFIQDITFQKIGGTKSTNYRGILLSNDSYLYIKNVNLKGLNNAIYPRMTSKTVIGGTINFEDCGTCLISVASVLTSDWQAVVNFNNCNIGFAVYSGGQIHSYGISPSYTNVTTKTSQSVGTATNDGWITGITV